MSEDWGIQRDKGNVQPNVHSKSTPPAPLAVRPTDWPAETNDRVHRVKLFACSRRSSISHDMLPYQQHDHRCMNLSSLQTLHSVRTRIRTARGEFFSIPPRIGDESLTPRYSKQKNVEWILYFDVRSSRNVAVGAYTNGVRASDGHRQLRSSKPI